MGYDKKEFERKLYKVRHDFGKSPEKIRLAYEKWAKKKSKYRGIKIKESTVRNYINENAPNTQNDFTKALGTFIDQEFFPDECRSHDDLDLDQRRKKFADAARVFFKSKAIHSYQDMEVLEGPYAMYRRCWHKPATDYIICSRLEIQKSNSQIFTFEECQEWTHKDKKNPVSENDFGYIFPYSSQFIALTNGNKAMKMYSLNYVSPEPKKGEETEYFQGHVIVHTGQRPHKSMEFHAVKIDLNTRSRKVPDKQKKGLLKIENLRKDIYFNEILNHIL